MSSTTVDTAEAASGGPGQKFPLDPSNTELTRTARAEPSAKRAPATSEITLVQRMISACVGSVLTSLVVTPFDVVKIRLQQQEMLYPAGAGEKESCKAFWEEAVVASPNNACVCGGECVRQPRVEGTMSGMQNIAKTEGVSALYRGLGLTLLMSVPSNVVYFSGYEILRDSSPIGKDHPYLNPLLCGSFARILAATSVAPFELIKTRLQSVPSATKNTKSSDIMKVVLGNTWKEVKSNGIFSIFKGLQLTLFRDVPFSGIYWASYETVSKWLKTTKWLNASKDNDGDKFNKTIFTRSFLSGSLSGVVAAIVTNPFDVGKTRCQVSSETQKSSYGTLSSLAKKQMHAAAVHNGRGSMFAFLYHIYKTEGFGALYVGIVPRCLKIAPSCAIMISTYEVAKKFFAKADAERAAAAAAAAGSGSGSGANANTN